MIDNYQKTIIALFAVMLLTLLATSIALFIMKIGIEPADIAQYYMGDEEAFIVKKSFEGLSETTAPHLFAITIMIFIVIHLLLFTNYKKYITHLLAGLLISFIADMASGYFLIANLSIFAIIKWVSFLIFQTLFIIAIFLIISDIMRHKTI